VGRANLTIPRPIVDVRVLAGLAPDDPAVSPSPEAPTVSAAEWDERLAGQRQEMQAEHDRTVQQLERRLAESRSEVASALTALGRAVAEVGSMGERMIADAERQMIDLSVDIARKILRQAIDAGAYDIDPIVAKALKQISTREQVTVHLSPADYKTCQMIGQAPAGVSFVSDPAVQPAECLLNTGEGVIDTSVDAQLDDVSEALKTLE
jgi:flagellar biosynthesis/type III secretory pathway protein FliH